MKFSVLTSNLSRGLNTVSRTVSTKGTLPILSHVLIRADKGFITLAATNLEIGVNYQITGKIEEPGEITVPAKILAEFVGSLSEEKVEISTNELVLSTKGEHTETNINGSEAAEFPLIPDIKEGEPFLIKGKDLKNAISEVVIAAAVDETRPILSGVFMKFKDSSLTMAATDSYRLAEKIIELEKKSSKETAIVVPTRTLAELGRILADTEGDVKMYVNENQVSFEVSGHIDLVSRLIDGQFPNYRQIIPEKSETEASVSVLKLNSALKIAQLFARESANTIKIEFRKKGGLYISAASSQVGDASSTVPAKIEGAEGEISLNVRYVLDALANLKSEEINLEISGKLNPAVIRPVGKDKGYLYIVMPLRS